MHCDVRRSVVKRVFLNTKGRAMSGIGKLAVTIRGTTALCMHSPQAADPLCEHPRYKPFKKLSSKKQKTEEDHRELAEHEWYLSLYVNESGQLYLPGRGIEAALKDAAKRQKLGKKFNASVMVDDALLKFPDMKMSIDELWASKRYFTRTGQKVNQARVMRTTPRFPEWSADLVITFMSTEVDEDKIVGALKDLGSINGMFEFRPHFGRFEIV